MAKGSVIEYRGKRGTTWRIKYVDAAGKQVMETVGKEAEGFKRKDAEAALRARLVDVERDDYRKPGPLTFAAYAERWFAEGKTRRRWKDSTVAQYRNVEHRLVSHFGPMPLAAIRPRHVAEYVAECTDAAATISRDVSLLHAIFKSAKREELVASNPAEGAERPKLPRRSWRILEPVEVARVAKAFSDEQARLVFLVLIQLGLRRGELQRLRWRDVDLVENVVRVREAKTEEGIRAIALPPSLAEELWQHRRRSSFQGEDELVFCHPQLGSTYHYVWFREALSAALVAAGIEGKVRPFHDLRHASLTNGAAAGENPIALMTRAGHRSMKTTQVYLHLAGTLFRDEAEALERRLLGSSSVESSTDLGEPERT